MAISVTVYSNANSSSKTISFDFVGEILAANTPILAPTPANVSSTEYFFKVTCSATQDNSVAFPVKIVRSFSELVLNGQKQRATNTANAYSDVRSMIVDYVYDYINGHTANLYGSGCSVQNPMKF